MHTLPFAKSYFFGEDQANSDAFLMERGESFWSAHILHTLCGTLKIDAEMEDGSEPEAVLKLLEIGENPVKSPFQGSESPKVSISPQMTGKRWSSGVVGGMN